jgi:acyl-CoA reductase-like NAD-dependent aldehyde dehydrogenase
MKEVENMAGLVSGRKVNLTADTIESAVAHVSAVAQSLRKLSSFDRANVLDKVAALLASDKATLARRLTDETGYLTFRDMMLEVERTIEVFTLAAAVARIGIEETVNLDAVARGRNALGIIKREPIGPVLGITAFNGPILIAAHKIAPAILANTPIVLKPSPRVPNSAVALGEHVVAAGWPSDALAVLPVDNEGTARLIRDPRLPVITFTGGEFGWRIKDMVPRKRVHLEMGGVGAVLIAADADLDLATEQCSLGGFVRSGQACLAVQRVYIERSVYADFLSRFAKRVAGIRVGEVADPATEVGPLVSVEAAGRVSSLIDDAIMKGARRLCGGSRVGAAVPPTLLADATGAMRVMREEAFGPVVAVAPVDTLDEAVHEANIVGGAIHVGIFTQSICTAFRLAEELHAGGVIVNGSSAWRVDQMPYGGVGTSGFGREGIRYMVEEYTERKIVVIRH